MTCLLYSLRSAPQGKVSLSQMEPFASLGHIPGGSGDLGNTEMLS